MGDPKYDTSDYGWLRVFVHEADHTFNYVVRGRHTVPIGHLEEATAEFAAWTYKTSLSGSRGSDNVVGALNNIVESRHWERSSRRK